MPPILSTDAFETTATPAFDATSSSTSLTRTTSVHRMALSSMKYLSSLSGIKLPTGQRQHTAQKGSPGKPASTRVLASLPNCVVSSPRASAYVHKETSVRSRCVPYPTLSASLTQRRHRRTCATSSISYAILRERHVSNVRRNICLLSSLKVLDGDQFTFYSLARHKPLLHLSSVTLFA
ncbi:hypothetical protein PENSPDRAFT_372850 [Peniophora sp. CONT]|nr:hypothetical protein PENSPDRAFT_372850 [Peniophora sp. CONT]